LAHRQVAIAAVLLIVLNVVACTSRIGQNAPNVAGVDPRDTGLTRELLELDRQIQELEIWLSDYPGQFESEKERRIVHARWFSAVERASVLMNVDLGNPEIQLRAGMLYRQGHNLDIPEAASSAYSILSRCISLSPQHVECRYELARLFLSSDARFAPAAEKLLLEARSLIAPAIRPEFEAALANAFFKQGQRSSALRQIDRYLTLVPDDVKAQRFRSTLIFEVKRDAQFEQ